MKSLQKNAQKDSQWTRRTTHLARTEDPWRGGRPDHNNRLGPGCWGLSYQTKGLQLPL